MQGQVPWAFVCLWQNLWVFSEWIRNQRGEFEGRKEKSDLSFKTITLVALVKIDCQRKLIPGERGQRSGPGQERWTWLEVVRAWIPLEHSLCQQVGCGVCKRGESRLILRFGAGTPGRGQCGGPEGEDSRSLVRALGSVRCALDVHVGVSVSESAVPEEVWAGGSTWKLSMSVSCRAVSTDVAPKP